MEFGLLGLLLFAAFGVTLLVYGYPLFRMLLPIFGFMIGFVVGYSLVPPDQWLLAMMVSIGLAIALGALAMVAWSLVLALAGIIFGAGLGLGLGVALGGTGIWLAIAGAVVGGLLFYRFRDLMVILLTALNGAWMLVAGAAEVLGQDQLITRTKLALTTDLSVSPSWLILIAFVVVGVIGIVVQYRLFGHRDAYSGDVYQGSGTL
jgi:hypothetical protein